MYSKRVSYVKGLPNSFQQSEGERERERDSLMKVRHSLPFGNASYTCTVHRRMSLGQLALFVVRVHGVGKRN